MSKDRDLVFRTTRVRTSLKNDVSWIQNPKSPPKQQEQSCEEPAVNAVRTRPSPLRQNSYVLNTAKKFEVQSPTEDLEKTLPNSDAVSPVDPVNTTSQTEVVHAESHDQVDIEETTQSSADVTVEDVIQNGEAQPHMLESESPVEPEQQPVPNPASENEEGCAESNDQSCVENNEETHAEVTTEGVIQNGEDQLQILESESPAEPEQQLVANTATENMEYTKSNDQSCAEHTEETPQSSTEVTVVDVIHNDEAQPLEPEEQPVANTASENVEECAKLNGQSCVEHTEETAQSSVQDTVEDVNHNVEAQPQILASEESPKKDECVDAPIDESNIKHIEEAVQTSEDADVEGVHNGAAQCISESPVEVSPVEPVEEPLSNTSSENKEGHSNISDDQQYEETAQSSADVEEVVQNGQALPEESGAESPVESQHLLVANPTGEKGNEHDDALIDQTNVEHNEKTCEVSECAHTGDIQNVELQPDSNEDPESGSPVEETEQTVSNTASENNEGCADVLDDQSHVEHNEQTVQSSIDVVVEKAESSVQPDELPGSNIISDKEEEFVATPNEQSNNENHEEAPEAPADIHEETEERKDEEMPEVLSAEPQLEEEHASESESAYLTVESNAQAVEGEGPSEVMEETVPDVVEVVLESPNGGAESHTEATAECPVTSVECEVVSETLAPPTPNIVPEKVQADDNCPDEQNVEPLPEAAADSVAELNIEDALELLTPSEAEAVEDKEAEAACTSCEEAPTIDTIPEPVVEPEGSHSEEVKPNQQRCDTNVDEDLQKPAEVPSLPQTVPEPEPSDDQTMCSFCDQVIGNVKITFSEPFFKCHPECLKCAVCSKILGDLISPMFLHDQKVHCDVCFASI